MSFSLYFALFDFWFDIYSYFIFFNSPWILFFAYGMFSSNLSSDMLLGVPYGIFMCYFILTIFCIISSYEGHCKDCFLPHLSDFSMNLGSACRGRRVCEAFCWFTTSEHCRRRGIYFPFSFFLIFLWQLCETCITSF